MPPIFSFQPLIKCGHMKTFFPQYLVLLRRGGWGSVSLIRTFWILIRPVFFVRKGSYFIEKCNRPLVILKKGWDSQEIKTLI